MAETEPGRTKPDSTWGGTWTTVTKADYDKAVAEAHGLSGLSVFASATRPNGDDYTYTAWGLKGADVPLIASELRDCGPDWSRVPSANCPGSHTFWSFTAWPQWRCGPCGETVRRERPQCLASVMHCEECGTALEPVTAVPAQDRQEAIVSHPFEPDWILPPGTILRLELAERGVTEAQFAELSGLGAETVHGLLAGTVKIGGVVASRIARVIGTSGTMWLNLQATYDAALAKGAKGLSGAPQDYGKDQGMGEMDAAARAAGYEVEARCSIAHGDQALLELPGEQEAVRVPLAEVAAGLGVAPGDVPGARLLVTVRESVESGRALSGFRPVG